MDIMQQSIVPAHYIYKPAFVLGLSDFSRKDQTDQNQGLQGAKTSLLQLLKTCALQPHPK